MGDDVTEPSSLDVNSITGNMESIKNDSNCDLLLQKNNCTQSNTTLASDESSITPKSKLSKTSKELIAESQRLLAMCGDVSSQLEFITDIKKAKDVSSDINTAIYEPVEVTTFKNTLPPFHRVDLDDLIEETVGKSKPAWKQLENSVSDSYHRAKLVAERTKTDNNFLEGRLKRSSEKRAESPFSVLQCYSRSRSPTANKYNKYEPRSSIYRSSSCARYPSISDTNYNNKSFNNISNPFVTEPYAAPAVSKTQGIESKYDKLINDIESRLWKTTRLSSRPMTYSSSPYRSMSCTRNEKISTNNIDDDDDIQPYFPRTYYSRPDRSDPDYFDFDLTHSVNLYKKHPTKYTPKGPQNWEHNLVSESTRSKGDNPISGYLFTKGDSDYRTNGTSYLSAALRTASFWEHRFQSIGKQVLEKNPVTLESLGRLKPIPNKFTEYRDPDFEDYVDPKEDD
uniref:PH domain-containing protein n=1 Tax=Strongyloides stercoralis TaxID=6248 RepID=A0A0K0EP33_STRER